MLNDRLTEMNQYGDILYCGKYKKGTYNKIGDYPEDLANIAIEEVLCKLYYLENAIEEINEQTNHFIKSWEAKN